MNFKSLWFELVCLSRSFDSCELWSSDRHPCGPFLVPTQHPLFTKGGAHYEAQRSTQWEMLRKFLVGVIPLWLILDTGETRRKRKERKQNDGLRCCRCALNWVKTGNQIKQQRPTCRDIASCKLSVHLTHSLLSLSLPPSLPPSLPLKKHNPFKSLYTGVILFGWNAWAPLFQISPGMFYRVFFFG